MRRLFWLFTMPILLFLAACSGQGATTDDGKINVVATIGQITDVVQMVGGAHVQVTGLMSADVPALGNGLRPKGCRIRLCSSFGINAQWP